MASAGTIENSGTITFNSDATILSGVDFNMNGNGNSASLVINAEVHIDTPDFNLDAGAQSGNVTTINAGGMLDLDLGAGADEEFGHTINMNGGAELDVTTSDNDWGLSSNGEINVAGGGTSQINGETFIVEGDINVTGNSTLNVGASTEYEGTANVTIAAGSVLNHGAVTYSGGSYTGNGLLKKGTATITESTTWDVATVDLDDGDTHIQNGWLKINADSIDDAGDGIDADITIDKPGFFTVNLSDGSDVVFENGSLTYETNNSIKGFLPGSSTGSALRFDNSSSLNVNGDGSASVRIKMNGGDVNINDTNGPIDIVNDDGRLLLGGGNHTPGNTNEIAGSTVSGIGELQMGTGRALRGHGTIDTAIRGFGGAQLIAEGGTLNVNGGVLDMGTLGTDGAAAVLNITDAWNTNVADDVILNGGVLQGANIENDNANGIEGEGEITARVSNNTLIKAQNGTLVVNNPLTDWDGGSESGVLRANSGVLELQDDSSFPFDGSVIASSGTVFANGFSLNFKPGSTLSLSKGVFQSTAGTNFGGTITANGPFARLAVSGDATFQTTSSTTLNGDLDLENTNTIVEAGASFAGVGNLINAENKILSLESAATIGVSVINRGNFQLGSDTGQVNVVGFEQENTGTYFADVQGASLGDFDYLLSTGLAQLDGTLAVNLLAAFNPELGDVYTLISAIGGVVGNFATEDFSSAPLDAGLAWDVLYNPNNVQLLVVAALPGDANGDGVVDLLDLDILGANFGMSPANYGQGDFNGDNVVDLLDLDILGANFGAMAAEAMSQSVPEPTAALLAGWLLTLILGRQQRVREER